MITIYIHAEGMQNTKSAPFGHWRDERTSAAAQPQAPAAFRHLGEHLRSFPRPGGSPAQTWAMPSLSTFSDLAGLFLYISSPCLMVAFFLISSFVALIPFPIPTSFPQAVSLPFLPVPPLCLLASLTHNWLGEEELIRLRLFRYVTSKKLSA